MMIFFVLALLLFGGALLALLVGGGVMLHEREGNGGRARKRPEPTARETLDERLARGEIGRDEYEAIRHQIES